MDITGGLILIAAIAVYALSRRLKRNRCSVCGTEYLLSKSRDRCEFMHSQVTRFRERHPNIADAWQRGRRHSR